MPDRPETSGTAFVLMPFDADFDAIYRDLIRPALEDVGFTVQRADDFLHQRNVLKDIVRGIADADLVVADLTSANPNVFYELGLAHGLNKPTVLMAQIPASESDAGDAVPFDLRTYRIIFYSTRFDEVGKLKDGLVAVGRAALAGELLVGNPLTDFADRRSVERAGRDLIDQESHRLGGGTAPTQEDEKQTLDLLETFEAASERLNGIIEQLGEATDEMTDDLVRATSRMERLSAGGNASAGQIRRAVASAASDISRYSKRVEDTLPDLQSTIEEMTSNGLTLLRTDFGDNDDVPEALASLVGLLDGITGGIEAVSGMANAMREWPDNLSADLNRSRRRALKALERLIIEFQNAEAFARTGIGLLDERLESDDETDREAPPGSAEDHDEGAAG